MYIHGQRAPQRPGKTIHSRIANYKTIPDSPPLYAAVSSFAYNADLDRTRVNAPLEQKPGRVIR